MTQEIPKWTRIAKDGELILMARDPLDKNSDAVLYNEISNTYSAVHPTQVFFKWGNFVEIRK